MEYGYTTEFDGSTEEAVEKVESTLKDNGFGVLTDLDIAEKLKQKLGEEIEDYRILGACSPKHAFDAIQKEHEIGLLLPCNVIVYRKDGSTYVSAIQPEEALGITGNDELEGIAEEVGDGLRDAIDRV